MLFDSDGVKEVGESHSTWKVDVETGPEDERESFQDEESTIERQGTIPGTVFNTVNTIVGAGVLGLPYTFAQVGWGGAIIVLSIATSLTWYGLHLLTCVAHKNGGNQNSFGSLAEINVWFPLVVDILIWIFMFSVSILYLGTAADFLVLAATYFAPNADPGAWYMSRTFYLTLPFVCFGVLLSIPRKLTILQYTSGLAIVCILFAAIVVASYTSLPVDELCGHFLAVNNGTECFGENCCISSEPGARCCIGAKVAIGDDFGAFVSSFPVLGVSFCSAPQVLALFNDLRRPTVRRMDLASGFALGLCASLYLVIGLGGYFTYGSNVSNDLLGSYPLNLTVSIVRIAVAFVVSVSFPLMMQIARDATLHFVISVYELTAKRELTSSNSRRILYYVVLAVLLASAYAIGMLGLDMTFLLNLGGSLSAGNISFTLPGLYYWHYMRHEGLTMKRLSCLFMIIFGILIMIANIILWVI